MMEVIVLGLWYCCNGFDIRGIGRCAVDSSGSGDDS